MRRILALVLLSSVVVSTFSPSYGQIPFCGIKPITLPPLGCAGGQLVCVNGIWVWVGCR